MTTIGNYSLTMPSSPRAMMDSRINAAVEAGSLSQVDGDALETALDSIDSSLASSTKESSSRLDPSEMKGRIDSLIDEQVSAGTLTEDQAATLQSFFAQGGPPQAGSASGEDGISIDGMQAMGGMGGPEGMRSPPPPPPSGGEESDSSSTTSSIDTASAADQLDSIITFLENLRASLSQSLYGTASNSSTSSNSGLVVDSMA